jgi:hypothetical protein
LESFLPCFVSDCGCVDGDFWFRKFRKSWGEHTVMSSSNDKDSPRLYFSPSKIHSRGEIPNGTTGETLGQINRARINRGWIEVIKSNAGGTPEYGLGHNRASLVKRDYIIILKVRSRRKPTHYRDGALKWFKGGH